MATNSSRSIWRRDKQSCSIPSRYSKPQTRGVHLAIARDPVSGNFAVVSSRPTTLQTLWDYGLRFDIEENFWMTSRIAFNSKPLACRQALGRLMLVLAVATLFLDTGTALVHSGNRRLIGIGA